MSKRTPRRKLTKKTKAPIDNETRKKLRVIKKYPKERCIEEGCQNYAVGKMDVCKKHGGDPIIEENLLLPDEILPPALLNHTKYNPAYHPMAFIEMSRDGMSTVEIAAQFQVAIVTVRKWSETFAEFNTAYEVGQAMHEAWWLAEGKNNLDNRGYNTGLFKFITGNKLGYSDKIESKNLNVTAGVLLVPGQMTPEDWEKSAK